MTSFPGPTSRSARCTSPATPSERGSWSNTRLRNDSRRYAEMCDSRSEYESVSADGTYRTATGPSHHNQLPVAPGMGVCAVQATGNVVFTGYTGCVFPANRVYRRRWGRRHAAGCVCRRSGSSAPCSVVRPDHGWRHSVVWRGPAACPGACAANVTHSQVSTPPQHFPGSHSTPLLGRALLYKSALPRSAGVGRVRGGAAEAAEPQAVADDEHRAECHRRPGDHGGEQSGGSQRECCHVVAECPEQVPLDRAEGTAGKSDRVDGSSKIAADQGEVGGLDRDLGPRPPCQPEIGVGQGSSIVDAIADHGHDTSLPL